MTELVAVAKAVRDRDSFVEFVAKLSADLRADSGAWGNRDLGRYLDALASWVEDMDGYYENQGRPSRKMSGGMYSPM